MLISNKPGDEPDAGGTDGESWLTTSAPTGGGHCLWGKVGCPLVGSHSSSRQGGHRGILVGPGCPGKSLLQIAPLTPVLAPGLDDDSP